VLQSRAVAIFAVAERVEQSHERFADSPDERGRDERLELDRGLRRAGESPRRDDAEPRYVARDGGDETQIVDRGLRAIVHTAGERRLELARQARRERV